MFRRTVAGVAVLLSADDREILGQIPWLLASVVPDETDEAYEVLHRSAYGQDEAASREFASLTSRDAEIVRAQDRSIVTELAEGKETLTRDEALSVLRSINEARLVLAARAGAFDESAPWENRIAEDPALAAVGWLAYIQSELLEAVGPEA